MHSPSSLVALAEGARDLAQEARALAASWGHGFALEQAAADTVAGSAEVLVAVARDLEHDALHLNR